MFTNFESECTNSMKLNADSHGLMRFRPFFALFFESERTPAKAITAIIKTANPTSVVISFNMEITDFEDEPAYDVCVEDGAVADESPVLISQTVWLTSFEM